MAQNAEMTVWLETERGDRLPVEGICTFGRTEGNSVILPMEKMSRRHAMIHEQGGEFWIVDLGSTNGFQINGERVTHPVRLRAGDLIQMPAASFTFRQLARPAPGAGYIQATQMTQSKATTPDIRLVNCWILLADLQGFTRMSQQMPAAELAPLVGKWMAGCQDILRRQKGVLAKFLGDGFLAYWTARDETAAAIASACGDFQALQKSAPLPFRIVLHYGEVSFGGRSPDAANTMISPELNFAFRLEKVASRLKLLWLFSDAAAGRLQGHMPLVSCGAQKVPDFEPERTCFTLGG
jgi:class 3 adenylate cyclase